MMKVQPDLGSIFANLNSAGVEGAIKSYCLARINGTDVSPELAKAAYAEAQSLISAGSAANSSDVSVGAGKTVAIDLLQALVSDIQMYAKVASSRYQMLKLAEKFAAKVK